MVEMQFVNYVARDGMDIPGYLSLPLHKNKLSTPVPLVVMPHGGPWARDYWGFDNYVQFLASKGYAVFQPQFRGSTGLGFEHQKAGYGEWGNKIQNDITDGVNWLIEKEIVDKDKICIFGASFGGYAAAMGLVSTPDLYQCAASINGIHNLPKLLHKNTTHLYSTINKMVSNKYGDAKNFSPYHQVEKIQKPMLIIANEKDTVVDVSQSRSFVRLLKKKNKDVEYLELEGGEHWRTDENHEIQSMRALESFLEKYLSR